MKKYIIPLVIIGLALGFPLNVAADGNSGCYSVQGGIDAIGCPQGFCGTASGDVEATVITVGGLIEIHGIVIFRPVEQAWEVTGGNVEPLLRRTLLFDNDF